MHHHSPMDRSLWYLNPVHYPRQIRFAHTTNQSHHYLYLDYDGEQMKFRISGRCPSSSHTPRLEKNGKTLAIIIPDAEYNVFCDSLRHGYRSSILFWTLPTRGRFYKTRNCAYPSYYPLYRMRLSIPITNSHLPSHRQIFAIRLFS